MMKFSKREGFLLVVFLAVVVLGLYLAFSGGGDKEVVRLGPEDDEKVVTVEQGTEAVLKLPENPSTGYKWRFELEGDFAELLENKYIPPENQVPGKGGTRKVKLRVIGSGKLVMSYGRPWENKIIKKFITTFEIR